MIGIKGLPSNTAVAAATADASQVFSANRGIEYTAGSHPHGSRTKTVIVQ